MSFTSLSVPLKTGPGLSRLPIYNIFEKNSNNIKFFRGWTWIHLNIRKKSIWSHSRITRLGVKIFLSPRAVFARLFQFSYPNSAYTLNLLKISREEVDDMWHGIRFMPCEQLIIHFYWFYTVWTKSEIIAKGKYIEKCNVSWSKLKVEKYIGIGVVPWTFSISFSVFVVEFQIFTIKYTFSLLNSFESKQFNRNPI